MEPTTAILLLTLAVLVVLLPVSWGRSRDRKHPTKVSELTVELKCDASQYMGVIRQAEAAAERAAEAVTKSRRGMQELASETARMRQDLRSMMTPLPVKTPRQSDRPQERIVARTVDGAEYVAQVGKSGKVEVRQPAKKKPAPKR